jgi:hypothetical protein
MRRHVLLLRFEPQATAPSGDPPTFDVKSGPGTVTSLEGGASEAVTGASYETHVSMTDATHFVEDGELTLDGGSLRVSTVGSGVLEPAAEEGTIRGAVIWQVEEGTGRWRDTSGLITSNFELHPETGTSSEHQVMRLFLP